MVGDPAFGFCQGLLDTSDGEGRPMVVPEHPAYHCVPMVANSRERGKGCPIEASGPFHPTMMTLEAYKTGLKEGIRGSHRGGTRRSEVDQSLLPVDIHGRCED